MVAEDERTGQEESNTPVAECCCISVLLLYDTQFAHSMWSCP